MNDPQNVSKSVTLYASFYNLKCKTLIELTALKNLSIQRDSVLTSRIAKCFCVYIYKPYRVLLMLFLEKDHKE